jgi:hypothetical protein
MSIVLYALHLPGIHLNGHGPKYFVVRRSRAPGAPVLALPLAEQMHEEDEEGEAADGDATLRQTMLKNNITD